MHAFRGSPDARIEGVARIQLFVVGHQSWLRIVKMADIVLGWVFRATQVEQLPHALLDRLAIVALRDDVVLVEHMAEEVAVVELVQDRRIDVRRQPFRPLFVIAPSRSATSSATMSSTSRSWIARYRTAAPAPGCPWFVSSTPAASRAFITALSVSVV
jgi:hypothetical protein